MFMKRAVRIKKSAPKEKTFTAGETQYNIVPEDQLFQAVGFKPEVIRARGN